YLVAVLDVVGGPAEYCESEEEHRKQRQQGVVGDRRRIRQVVAVVETLEAAPEGQTCQTDDVTRGTRDAGNFHATSLCQACRLPASAPASCAWVKRNTGTLAPSQIRTARDATRRSGGFVSTT